MDSLFSSGFQVPRFRTDPTLPGTEALALMDPDSAFLTRPKSNLAPLTGDGQGLKGE